MLKNIQSIKLKFGNGYYVAYKLYSFNIMLKLIILELHSLRKFVSIRNGRSRNSKI